MGVKASAKRPTTTELRPRDRCEDRRAEILAAAHDLFLERGFAATSTDAIVKRSGGSKDTLYANFGSKAGLFHAVVEAAVAASFSEIDAPSLDPAQPLGGLRHIGVVVLCLWVKADTIGVIRLLIAEGSRVPEIRALLARSRSKMTEHVVVNFLRRCGAQGTLRVRQPKPLAQAFIALALRPALYALVTMTPLSMRQIERHIDAILPVFFRLCEEPLALPGR